MHQYQHHLFQSAQKRAAQAFAFKPFAYSLIAPNVPFLRVLTTSFSVLIASVDPLSWMRETAACIGFTLPHIHARAAYRENFLGVCGLSSNLSVGLSLEVIGENLRSGGIEPPNATGNRAPLLAKALERTHTDCGKSPHSGSSRSACFASVGARVSGFCASFHSA